MALNLKGVFIMYLICGIHGVGKTVFAEFLSKKKSIKYYSASQLIENEIQSLSYTHKDVHQILENQELLLHALSKIKDSQYILDGHLCLINDKKEVEKIPYIFFKKLNLDFIYLIVNTPAVIQQHLIDRDNQIWDLNFIEHFQHEEIKYARELSTNLHIPLKIIYSGSNVATPSPSSENNNVILPIKPIFAEKILRGEKRYEYRKRLCQKDIKKIYIYATAPTKKIIGEAEVTRKIKMNKNNLWRKTQLYSGISQDFFYRYFNNQEDGFAYEIGQVKQYDIPITLESIGIKCAPQSFIYCHELNIDIYDTHKSL